MLGLTPRNCKDVPDGPESGPIPLICKDVLGVLHIRANPSLL
jgi:hypothetical protein